MIVVMFTNVQYHGFIFLQFLVSHNNL